MDEYARWNYESVFTMEATPLKYSQGASDGAGWELNIQARRLQGT